MQTKPPPPETIGSVPLNSGIGSTGHPYGGVVVKGKFQPNTVGEMRREVDPEGRITSHPVRRSAYVHERLHNLTGPQKLADELYDAAEKFRQDFERAQLSGSYARMDLFKARSGKHDISDNVLMAKIRMDKAFDALVKNRETDSYSQSCMWHVVGLGHTLEGWTALMRAGGARIDSNRTSSIFREGLQTLAIHYGLLDAHRISAMAQERSYARGIRAVLDFANVFSAGEQSAGKDAMGRFMAEAQKRFAKFA